MARLTLPRVRDLGAAPKGKTRRVTDDACTGLLVRVTDEGRKSWWMRSTVDGKRREIKIGTFPDMTLVDARAEVERRRTGPKAGAAEGPTMTGLWERYERDHAKPKKAASSAAKDAANWKLHVAPVLGAMLVADVKHDDVARLHASISKASPGAANRVVALLSKMFSLAVKWSMRPHHDNPAKGIDRNDERRVERYLTPSEYGRLVAALDGEDEVVRDAISFAMHTGARIGEVLDRTVDDVDEQRQRLRMERTKTERSTAWLTCSPIAWAIVMRRKDAGQATLFPISYDRLYARWTLIRERAKLPGLRLHDLRHAFASVGAAQGMSLPQIGALLRHKSPATTARYSHLASDQQQAHAALISSAIPTTATTDAVADEPPARARPTRRAARASASP